MKKLTQVTDNMKKLILIGIASIWLCAGCGDNRPGQPVECMTDAECDDGRFCNGPERCANAICRAGTVPAVDDGIACTVDSCDEVNDTVVHLPYNDSCDDGLFCNGAERCDVEMGCQAGVAPRVDDGLGCTVDSCDEVNDVMVMTFDDTACDDGDQCTTEVCAAGVGCQTTATDMVCACDTPIYDSGTLNIPAGANPQPANWAENGIIDNFTVLESDSAFCAIEFLVAMFSLAASDFQSLWVRIYDLGAGTISDLGDFTLAVPIFDQIFRVADNNLTLIDTQSSPSHYDTVRVIASGEFDIGPGNFAVHISLPDWTDAPMVWLSAPTDGIGQCAFTWGEAQTVPVDLCSVNGDSDQVENLDFRFLKSVP